MILKTSQAVIDFCKKEIESYMKKIIDCNDMSYLPYYQGIIIGHRSTLANLGYEFEINLTLEKDVD